jgi:hypothetical protein
MSDLFLRTICFNEIHLKKFFFAKQLILFICFLRTFFVDYRQIKGKPFKITGNLTTEFIEIFY